MNDAINLYGGIMEKLPLPLNDFEFTDQQWDSDLEPQFIQKVLETPDHSDVGIILEVDLSYPDAPHDIQSYFPQVKQQVEPCWLGNYQEEPLTYMQMNAPPSSNKVIKTLFLKKKYNLHYEKLKLYVQLGMPVEKMHRALAFNQSKWWKQYAQLNTQKRKEAKNKFDEENFKKLMVNSAFVRTYEGKRNRIGLKLARSEDETLRWTCTPQLKYFKIIVEDLATFSLNQTEMLWDKPTIVGAFFLDLSKKFMFDFHYNTIK